MNDVFPNTYKGIALFTPGGDLIYGVNHNKQAQWHSDLCLSMQKIWGLRDTPHFLIPGYTATVERWLNPQTQQVETIAEVHSPVKRYIPLLEALFSLETTTQWHIAPWQEEHCNRGVIETYRPHFPQLWEQQDLVIRQDLNSSSVSQEQNSELRGQNLISETTNTDTNNGYVLRLFIRGDRSDIEDTLSSIHQLLETGLNSPYSLKVIDIIKHPQQAANHQITATPTLLRVSPQPTRRIVGQLDDIQRVLNIITSL